MYKVVFEEVMAKCCQFTGFRRIEHLGEATRVQNDKDRAGFSIKNTNLERLCSPFFAKSSNPGWKKHFDSYGIC